MRILSRIFAYFPQNDKNTVADVRQKTMGVMGSKKKIKSYLLILQSDLERYTLILLFVNLVNIMSHILIIPKS